MPVQFKIIAKGQPGVPGGGEKRYDATILFTPALRLRDMLRTLKFVNA